MNVHYTEFVHYFCRPLNRGSTAFSLQLRTRIWVTKNRHNHNTNSEKNERRYVQIRHRLATWMRKSNPTTMYAIRPSKKIVGILLINCFGCTYFTFCIGCTYFTFCIGPECWDSLELELEVTRNPKRFVISEELSNGPNLKWEIWSREFYPYPLLQWLLSSDSICLKLCSPRPLSAGDRICHASRFPFLAGNGEGRLENQRAPINTN